MFLFYSITPTAVKLVRKLVELACSNIDRRCLEFQAPKKDREIRDNFLILLAKAATSAAAKKDPRREMAHEGTQQRRNMNEQHVSY